MGGAVKKKKEFGDPKAVAQLVSALGMLDDESHRQERQVLDDQHVLDSSFASNTTASFLDHTYQQLSSDDADSDRRRKRRPRLSQAAPAAVTGSVVPKDPTADDNDSAPAPTMRRLWVKDRSTAWWDEVSAPDYPEDLFRRAFRMGRATFDMICGELNSAVEKENTMLRTAIPVRQRVAVCVWRLATGEPLRLVSKRFGLGISTCHKLVLEVCAAMRDVLMSRFLQWPSSEDQLGSLGAQFQAISGIPNVVGAMYTTHIPIIAPKTGVSAYFNKWHTERNHKTSYSIIVQGVVDPSGVFTDVCIGSPGSMPDEQVLEKSGLYRRGANGMLDGMWVVGGAGHPLMDWVLVPYAQQHLTWTQHAFNERIGEVQAVARAAFSRLKGRWSCLQKRTEVKLQDLPVLLGACCVLHNICEQRREAMDPEFEYRLIDDEVLPENCVRSADAMRARDSIAHNLLHHAHAGTAFL
ncbi:putative nuclease [Nymphaea thermarum]|nr:putative nuclease [Nymphaea thermarum]